MGRPYGRRHTDTIRGKGPSWQGAWIGILIAGLIMLWGLLLVGCGGGPTGPSMPLPQPTPPPQPVCVVEVVPAHCDLVSTTAGVVLVCTPETTKETCK